MKTQQQSQAGDAVKKSQVHSALLVLLGALSTPAMSAGVGKLTITVENNQLTNSGDIKATATAIGGVSTALAGQRVISPVVAGQFNYASSNDRFNNTGTIEAKSTSVGGVSTALAGQVVIASPAVATADYRSANNRYSNTGQISATSTSTAGAATAVAGQDVTF